MENKKETIFSTNFFGYNKSEVDGVLYNLLFRINVLEGDLLFLKKQQLQNNAKTLEKSQASDFPLSQAPDLPLSQAPDLPLSQKKDSLSYLSANKKSLNQNNIFPTV